jgi:hypothetical protein
MKQFTIMLIVLLLATSLYATAIPNYTDTPNLYQAPTREWFMNTSAFRGVGLAYLKAAPIIVEQDTTTTSTTSTICDVNGSSLVIEPNWFKAGKTFKWTIVGTKTGANAVFDVNLYVQDASVVKLQSKSVSAGDWTATFYLTEYTDFAHQKAFGLLTNVNAVDSNDKTFDYAVDTHDFADATADTVKLTVKSGNSSDTVTVDYCLVEYWYKD